METIQRRSKVNHGKNIKRLCDIMKVTDEELADILNVDTETTNRYINSETLPDDVIKQISEALKVHPDIIKKMGEENINVNIQNNYEGSNANASQVAVQNHNFILNPFDKVIELYERLLRTKEEQIALLEEKLKGYK